MQRVFLVLSMGKGCSKFKNATQEKQPIFTGGPAPTVTKMQDSNQSGRGTCPSAVCQGSLLICSFLFLLLLLFLVCSLKSSISHHHKMKIRPYESYRGWFWYPTKVRYKDRPLPLVPDSSLGSDHASDMLRCQGFYLGVAGCSGPLWNLLGLLTAVLIRCNALLLHLQLLPTGFPTPCFCPKQRA